MLAWPREMPIDREPADVAAIVDSYREWFETSDRTWRNQREVAVVGSQCIQQDSSDEIAEALNGFI